MSEPKNGSALAGPLMRITALRRASEMLGPVEMSEALGIQPRSLRAKLGADRGVSDADLTIAATALAAHAERVAAMALKLRELAA